MSDASSPAPMMRSCKVSQSLHFARPGRGESSSRDGALSPASVRSEPAWSTGDVKDDNDDTNNAVTYNGDDGDDSSECAIELSLKQIEHFVKALNLHSYPLYPTKMWSKQ